MRRLIDKIKIKGVKIKPPFMEIDVAQRKVPLKMDILKINHLKFPIEVNEPKFYSNVAIYAKFRYERIKEGYKTKCGALFLNLLISCPKEPTTITDFVIVDKESQNDIVAQLDSIKIGNKDWKEFKRENFVLRLNKGESQKISLRCILSRILMDEKREWNFICKHTFGHSETICNSDYINFKELQDEPWIRKSMKGGIAWCTLSL